MVSRDIQFTPINGRTVRLTGDLSKCKTEQIHDVVTSLICELPDCEMVINIGDTVQVNKKSRHRVNIIRPGLNLGQTVCYDLSVARLTDSSVFVMPLMGMNRKLMLWDSLFVNAFCETEEDKDCIAILYRFSGEHKFAKFESALCSFRNFRRRVDTDPHHVLFVFEVPDDAMPSYRAYMDGKYSQIEDEWKLKILEFHGFDIDGHTGKILFRSPQLRSELERKLDVTLPIDAELHSKPDMLIERFDADYYAPRKSAI